MTDWSALCSLARRCAVLVVRDASACDVCVERGNSGETHHSAQAEPILAELELCACGFGVCVEMELCVRTFDKSHFSAFILCGKAAFES